jgi:hypothetical protein
MGSGRGGYRERAGRLSPFKTRPLTQIRVPTRFVNQVIKFVQDLEDSEDTPEASGRREEL